MILDVYSIFNAGNPNSIIRYIVKDPGWDYLITAIISLFLMITVFILNSQNRYTNDPVYITLTENKNYILKLREKGKSNEEIAMSFIKSLNENNLAKRIALKKAIKYLKRI